MNKKGVKYQISEEGRKIRSKCGRDNLVTWKESNPGASNLKHGAESQTVRSRFDDGRTAQGKALAAALKGLTDYFGGTEALTAPMALLIDTNVRPKLITLMCLSDFINKQLDVIDGKGRVLGCLDNYHKFSTSLRKDLQVLVGMGQEASLLGGVVKVPTLEAIINREKAGK